VAGGRKLRVSCGPVATSNPSKQEAKGGSDEAQDSIVLSMSNEPLYLVPELHTHGAGPNIRRLIRHFWDEATNVSRASGNYGTPFKGYYRRCPCCGMQVNPIHPTHINTEGCWVRTARRHQRDMAVRSALALRQQFTVHGDVLERVEVFRYLGRLLSQDDDDIQAVRSQLCKARGTWARIGQVL